MLDKLNLWLTQHKGKDTVSGQFPAFPYQGLSQ